MLLFIFIFGHVTMKGGVMFEKAILHRVFVYILHSENQIFGIVSVCEDAVKLLN
jgi:hypothetical protein